MDEISIKKALEDASRAAQNQRDAHKNAAEIARLRAELAAAQCDAADVGLYLTRRLAAAERERDERPAISRSDAAAWLKVVNRSGITEGEYAAYNRVDEALRAHATRAASEPGRCERCTGDGSLTFSSDRDAYEVACIDCNGTGRRGER